MGDHIALSCAAAAKPLDRFHGALITLSNCEAGVVIDVKGREDAGGRQYDIAIETFGRRGRDMVRTGLGGRGICSLDSLHVAGMGPL